MLLLCTVVLLRLMLHVRRRMRDSLSWGNGGRRWDRRGLALCLGLLQGDARSLHHVLLRVALLLLLEMHCLNRWSRLRRLLVCPTCAETETQKTAMAASATRLSGNKVRAHPPARVGGLCTSRKCTIVRYCVHGERAGCGGLERRHGSRTLGRLIITPHHGHLLDRLPSWQRHCLRGRGHCGKVRQCGTRVGSVVIHHDKQRLN